MKITINERENTIRFVNENLTELFQLGKLCERLGGTTLPTGSDGAKEIAVEKDKLIAFLTK